MGGIKRDFYMGAEKGDCPTRMTPKEAASYIGYSIYALAKWRGGKKVWREGNKGPRFSSCNGRIWYRRDWLDEWKDSVWAPVDDTCR